MSFEKYKKNKKIVHDANVLMEGFRSTLSSMIPNIKIKNKEKINIKFSFGLMISELLEYKINNIMGINIKYPPSK